LKFDSTIIPDSKLQYGKLLSKSDLFHIVHINDDIKFILALASEYVIHSFAVSKLDIKVVDATTPWGLNFHPERVIFEGVSYGQCLEICSDGHGFMPIVIESLNGEAHLYCYVNKFAKYTYESN